MALENQELQPKSASSVVAAFFEEGKPVYPCRCGETHRGNRAAAAYTRHNCFHASPLMWVFGPEEAEDSPQLICLECGQFFNIIPRAAAVDVAKER